MRRTSFALIVLLLTAGCSSGTDSGPASPSPSSSPSGIAPGGTFGDLVFFDEFDGPEVDPTKWFVSDGHQDYWSETPWRRNYKKENVYIEDGALVIQVVADGEGFSTGTVTTGDPDRGMIFEQAFGRFEARLRFPTQQGHWCAFWLWNMSVNGIDGSGRDGSEIDIIEKAVLVDQVAHTIHWDGYGTAHRSEGKVVDGMGLDDGEWHVIRLDWYRDEYIFFTDGVETWRTTVGGVSQAPNYIILSEEIGNFGVGQYEWGVGPIEDASLPDHFRVDYVRVWEYIPPDDDRN